MSRDEGRCSTDPNRPVCEPEKAWHTLDCYRHGGLCGTADDASDQAPSGS